MEQDHLPEFLRIEAEARESGIPLVVRQKHLAWWGLRFEKYAHFSKDPEFIKRCEKKRSMCFDLMRDRNGRG